MIIFFLIIVGFIFYALFTGPDFTKRKLAFVALVTAFSLSVIPSSVSGVLEEYPSDGDALGGGFIMLFALFAAFVVWVVLMVLIIKFPPLQVFCYGVAIIMAACFVFNCFLMGFNRSILLLLLVNSACFISCAFLIAKAKSLPMKIIAVTSTLALFILPWMILPWMIFS